MVLARLVKLHLHHGRLLWCCGACIKGVSDKERRPFRGRRRVYDKDTCRPKQRTRSRLRSSCSLSEAHSADSCRSLEESSASFCSSSRTLVWSCVGQVRRARE